MQFTYKVTYKTVNGDITQNNAIYDPRYPVGEKIIRYGYVRGRGLHNAWEKARKKFGDVRNVE